MVFFLKNAERSADCVLNRKLKKAKSRKQWSYSQTTAGGRGGAGTHAIVQLVKGSAATSCNVRLRGRGTYQHADCEAEAGEKRT